MERNIDRHLHRHQQGEQLAPGGGGGGEGEGVLQRLQVSLQFFRTFLFAAHLLILSTHVLVTHMSTHGGEGAGEGDVDAAGAAGPDPGDAFPDPEPSPPSIVAALNSGAGDDGEDAAPTNFSTQKTASHLIRRGGITCGADHAVRGPKGMRSAPDKAEVYSRAGGARLR